MNQDLRPSVNRRFTFAFDGRKVFVYAVKVVATFGPYSQIMRGDLGGGGELRTAFLQSGFGVNITKR